jgi:uncharacterized protein (TIGR01777 family)
MDIFPQVLISGASGLVGQALRSHLESEAVPYSTLARHATQGGSPAYFWDPYHFEFREEMRRLNGIRATIHLSGESLTDGRWTDEKKRRIRESRVRTTQSLVELLSRLERPPEVLICASAVGYYGNRGEEILTESSAPGDGFLPEVCREWEAAAAAAANLGVRVVSLRFGIILAADGGALGKMLPIFRLGAGGNLGNGHQWMSWISLLDVVRIIKFCMNDTQLEGPVNAVSAQPVPNAEFTEVLAHHLHRPAIVPAPAFALRLFFGEMADAALLSSTRAIPAKLQRSAFVFDHSSLQQAFQAVLPTNRTLESGP